MSFQGTLDLFGLADIVRMLAATGKRGGLLLRRDPAVGATQKSRDAATASTNRPERSWCGQPSTSGSSRANASEAAIRTRPSPTAARQARSLGPSVEAMPGVSAFAGSRLRCRKAGAAAPGPPGRESGGASARLPARTRRR
jgi:hypothetical protein